MRIGLIAGSGQFPLIFLKTAITKGYSVFVVAYLKEADPNITQYATAIEWLHLGQVRKLIKFFKKNNVDQIVMMGAIKKTRMFTDVRPDTLAISVIAGLKHTHDDNVLSAFAGLLTKQNLNVQPATWLIPDILAPEGCWTKRKPNQAEKRDISLGWSIAKSIGALDIGQCVVVGGGSVLAVEAIDGTDATILRGGKLGQGNAVAVKICKPNQDLRFDLPAIGLKTIENMHQADVRVLAVEAGKAVVFDREAMIQHADQLNLTIVAYQKDI